MTSLAGGRPLSERREWASLKTRESSGSHSETGCFGGKILHSLRLIRITFDDFLVGGVFRVRQREKEFCFVTRSVSKLWMEGFH